MAALAFIVGAYATSLLFLPMLRAPFLRAHFATIPWAAIEHLLGGSIAIVVGALQVNRGIRVKRPALHRWLGRLYVLGVVIGGSAALVLAPRAQGGWVSGLGFGLLGVLWLATTLRAFAFIRGGNLAAHRRWMILSYALTLAAVTLRVYLPATQVMGLPFIPSYRAIAWLCWVPNLIGAQWIVSRHGAPSSEDESIAAARMGRSDGGAAVR
jgi:uncharacterized membrane protein